MFEEDSWPDAPDCVFPNTGDKNSTFENTGILHRCFRSKNIDSIDTEFCLDGPSLDNKKASVGENLCSFPLGSTSLADDDLSTFDNSHVDKDTNDLLYYSWSELGNFEDADMMFSTCDSTFGLGASSEDDLGWFSSSDAIEGSGDGLRLDFKFQNPASNALENVSGILEGSRTKEMGTSVGDSGTKNQLVSYDGINDRDSGPIDRVISLDIQQQNEAHETETGYLCNTFSYMSANSYSDQTVLHPTSSTTESGYNHFMPLLPKDCSSQNHVQLMQRSSDPSFQMDTITISKKKADKLLQHSGVKFENSSDLVGINPRIPAELCSSIVAESTSISSRLDEAAEEAAGFHQLQHVTNGLDMRTKLCIRDSLYRLARSADQRHSDANVNNDSGDDRDKSQALTSRKTNKRKGYMDMERDTNPVDRSIAHLLFLRSSGSSVAPACDF